MFSGRKKPKKLLVAMSGGVDSSVAAALCVRDGIEVIGATLKLLKCSTEPAKQENCNTADEDEQIRIVAEKIGIRHYMLNAKDLFIEKVLTKSWNEYDSGRTPNPCALCNRFIKFGYLLEYARSMGAEGIATGHYVRIFVRGDGQVVLARGMDPEKDQSYFLSMVPAANLHHAYMPLGNLTKKEVRKIALDLGLPNAAKAESQDACIANIGDNLSETLRKLFDGRRLPGNFVDESGKILGRHDGIHNYTIGQRRGFKMGFGKPAFVKALDPRNGDVTIAFDGENLMSGSLEVPNMNWLSEEHSRMQNFPVSVQIRYRHKAVPAEVENFPGTGSPVRIRFKDPQRAVTPGQIAVIYDGDRVLGGGEIA